MLTDLFRKLEEKSSEIQQDYPYPMGKALLDSGAEAVINEQAALLSHTSYIIVEPGQEIHLWSNKRTVKVEPGVQGIELRFQDNDQRFEYYETHQRLTDIAKKEGLL